MMCLGHLDWDCIESVNGFWSDDSFVILILLIHEYENLSILQFLPQPLLHRFEVFTVEVFRLLGRVYSKTCIVFEAIVRVGVSMISFSVCLWGVQKGGCFCKLIL